jgi:hypothetical protein
MEWRGAAKRYCVKIQGVYLHCINVTGFDADAVRMVMILK